MKKYLAILLSVVLMLSLAIPAFAADEKGSITITNPTIGQTYSAYKILDLVSYDKDAKAYIYKYAEGWKDFEFESYNYTENDENYSVNASELLLEANGFVSWNKEFSTEKYAPMLAMMAKTYAEKKNIAPAGSITPDNDNPGVKFENLDLGYYLVDTTLGSLCSLNTTDPDVDMTEKNVEPTIKKQVFDTENAWNSLDDSAIGDTVTFRSFFTIDANAEGHYVVHDVMERGLTFDINSVKVYAIPGGTEKDLPGDESMESISDKIITGKYFVTEEGGDNCTFHVDFDETYTTGLTQDTLFVIEYKATLNGGAEIYEDLNNNKTWLQYGNSNTAESEADVRTVKVQIVKTDNEKNLLNGAKFELYDAKTAGNKIPLVKVEDGLYRPATPDEIKAEGFVSAVIEGSSPVIKGLESDVHYWLEETEAPAGYNKLTERKNVVLAGDNNTATFEDDENGETIYDDGGIRVINQAGAELPETGGMGTTIFYTVGGIMVAAAVVLLVTKKRMSVEG